MTPIRSGTRLRSEHNVFAGVITSFDPTMTLYGTELWEAPADGNEVKKGDKWLFVTHTNLGILVRSGWTALIHKGETICTNFKIVEEVPQEPTPSFQIPIVTVDISNRIVSIKNPDGTPVTGWRLVV
jgi:hypothetical protein